MIQERRFPSVRGGEEDMWVCFKLLVIRPAKGLDIYQAILADDGHGITFQCLQALLASNFDGLVIHLGKNIGQQYCMV